MKEVLLCTIRNEKVEKQITLNMCAKYAGFFGTYYLIKKLSHNRPVQAQRVLGS